MRPRPARPAHPETLKPRLYLARLIVGRPRAPKGVTMFFTADPLVILPLFTFGDRTFRCSQVTAADLMHVQARLDRDHPGAHLHIIQPCFNTTVALSAGTHDKDAVVDVSISGLTWPEAQTFLRRCGWAAWWRHTGDWADPSLWHIHMVSLAAYRAGSPVGEFIPGQVDDYLAHPPRDGLAAHSPDPTWHPSDITATVFDYAKWQHKQEDEMPFRDWPQADQDALTGAVADRVVSQLLSADVGTKDDATTVRQSLYRASNVPDLVRSVRDQILGKFAGK